MESSQIIQALLGILGFIGGLSVVALISIAKSVNDIKINIHGISIKHDTLEKRVDKIETKK